MNILFICTGNTCRSPMAAGIFEKMTREGAKGGAARFVIGSAGLAAAEGMPASENAVRVCAEIGVDLRGHHSRSLAKLKALDKIDLFVCMTRTHAQILLQAGVPQEKLFIPQGGIPDPFGGDIEVYRACRNAIQKALDPLLRMLQTKQETEAGKEGSSE